MLKRLAAALTFALLALPASAGAATTVGPDMSPVPANGPFSPCPLGTPATGSCTYVASGYPSSVNGVVVSWSVRADSPGTLALRVARPGSTPGTFSIVGDDARASVPGTGLSTFPTRLRIAKNDVFGVDVGTGVGPVTVPKMFSAGSGFDGAYIYSPSPPDNSVAPPSGSTTFRLLLSATVEPDADGDGFGDETQDACPGDAHDHAAPCGAVTVGTPFFPTATLAGSFCTAPCLWTDPGIAVPSAGVITRFRVYSSAAGGPYAIRPITPASISSSQLTGTTGPLSSSGSIGPTLDPFTGARSAVVDVRVPVATGDRVGFEAGAQLLTNFAPTSDSAMILGTDPVAPGPVTLSPFTNMTLMANADVEPDADHDGYGDSTQDMCPLDAANHDHACVADVKLVAPINPGPLTMLPNQAGTGLTVTNAGPASATNTVVTLTPPTGAQLAGATSTAGSCTTAATVTCALGTMASGASASIAVGVLASAPGNVAIAAHASSDVSDPDLSSNDASLFVSFGPALGIGAPKLRPCSVSKRGTATGNTIPGTAFGDKISGLGGRDIIHGNAGDDCLYGGLGDDVLFGDAGNDKLYGQTGDDRLLGGAGNDYLSGGSGKDNLSGGAGNDNLSGGTGNDRISGGPGNDNLTGGAGKDHITGDAGNDTVSARDRTRDTIDCGPGTDTATVDRIDSVKHCEHVHRR